MRKVDVESLTLTLYRKQERHVETAIKQLDYFK